jgi:hypothetical protein
VTNTQGASVLAAAGSEKAAFEPAIPVGWAFL